MSISKKAVVSQSHDINKELTSASTNIHNIESDTINNSLLKSLDSDVTELLEALKIVCEEFSEQVLTSRSVDCVSAHYAKLRGNAVIKELIPLAQSSKEANKLVGKIFRESLKRIYEHSGILNQSLNKPYGNPGDFSLLELVYEESAHPYSPTAVGRAIDQWAIHSGLATAVVNRKNALRLIIEEFASIRKASNSRAKVLSIASGAARELREIPLPLLANLDVTLLDIDKRGMAYAKAFFDTRYMPLNTHTVVADALDHATVSLLPEGQQYDLVYSFGLYDYLSDEMLLKSIQIGLDALDDNGTFIFCLKDHRYFDAWLYDWMMNWRFFPRVQPDGAVLAHQSGLVVDEVYTVEGKAVNVFICHKAK